MHLSTSRQVNTGPKMYFHPLSGDALGCAAGQHILGCNCVLFRWILNLIELRNEEAPFYDSNKHICNKNEPRHWVQPTVEAVRHVVQRKKRWCSWMQNKKTIKDKREKWLWWKNHDDVSGMPLRMQVSGEGGCLCHSRCSLIILHRIWLTLTTVTNNTFSPSQQTAKQNTWGTCWS